jgi:hypothetical protein
MLPFVESSSPSNSTMRGGRAMPACAPRARNASADLARGERLREDLEGNLASELRVATHTVRSSTSAERRGDSVKADARARREEHCAHYSRRLSSTESGRVPAAMADYPDVPTGSGKHPIPFIAISANDVVTSAGSMAGCSAGGRMRWRRRSPGRRLDRRTQLSAPDQLHRDEADVVLFSDVATQARVRGAIDDAHPATADFFRDPIVGQRPAGQRHAGILRQNTGGTAPPSHISTPIDERGVRISMAVVVVSVAARCLEAPGRRRCR